MSKAEVTDELMRGLERHKPHLELFDISDCHLTVPSLERTTTALLAFTELHSLDLSFNIVSSADN